MEFFGRDHLILPLSLLFFIFIMQPDSGRTAWRYHLSSTVLLLMTDLMDRVYMHFIFRICKDNFIHHVSQDSCVEM